jgi:hypothetical protein
VVGALCWVVVLLTVFENRFLYVFYEACGVRNSRLFEDMEVPIGVFVEICLICYICRCRHIARVVSRSLIFYFLVRLFPPTTGTFAYFLCTRVAPLCAFY